MRHRKKGRRLGRSSSHRKAMLKNMASSLFLTERDAELDDNEPKVKGRIVTTMQKAKEVRPLVERCITIARRSLSHQTAAEAYATTAERGSDEWKSWRSSDNYKQWNATVAPCVAARRRVLQMLGDKEAVGIVFDEMAPRFADRPGGYTRIMRLAQPRLGDGGQRVILEFVGVHDRVATTSAKPAFDGGDDGASAPQDDVAEPAAEEAAVEEEVVDEVAEAAADDGAAESGGDDEQK